MGNRAVIISKNGLDADGKIKDDAIGVYLHWNGGRESVEAFLAYCEAKGYRPPSEDCYGWAYLTTTICNFFGNGLSCGIDLASRLDVNNYDNGTYVIDKWKIVGRLYNYGNDVFLDEHTLKDRVREINYCQPKRMQISKEKLEAFLETYPAPEF